MSNDPLTPEQTPEDRYLGRLFYSRPAGNTTFGVFIIAIVLLAIESVPAWAFWEIGLSSESYILLGGCVGLLAGFVGAERRILGSLAGGICGAGAIMAIAAVLSWGSRIPSFVIIIAMMVGFMPGVAVYTLIDKVLGRPRQASVERPGAVPRQPEDE